MNLHTLRYTTTGRGWTTAVSSVLALCLLLLPTATKAIDVKSSIITMDDGLANNTVKNIHQDSKGFIWFATINGLCRYDGRNFLTYLPANNGKLSLADRRVSSIKEDGEQRLWVKMSPNLVSCYDMKTDRFIDFTGCGEHLTHYRGLDFLKSGTWLWGEEGCRRVIFRDGKPSSENFSKENGKLGSSNIRRVVETSAGAWIIADKGLYLWSDGKLAVLAKGISTTWVVEIGKTTYGANADGTVWKYSGKLQTIGTMGSGDSGFDISGQLVIGNKWYIFTSTGGYALDTRTGSLSRATGLMDIKDADVITDNRGNYWAYNGTGILRRIDRQTGEVKTLDLMSEQTLKTLEHERYFIVASRSGLTWITTNGDGLYAYDERSGKLDHFVTSDSKSAITHVNSYLCIAEDRSGNIWLGTWLYGAIKLTAKNPWSLGNPLDNALGSIGGNVRMLRADNDGVWISNHNCKLFKANATATQVLSTQDMGYNIYAMARDREGKTWIGSRTKGVFIDGRNYRHDKNDPTSLSNDAVFAIAQDHSGRMWIATLGGGINLAVPDGKGGYKFRAFMEDTYGLRSVRCLAVDQNGYVWAGTSEGVAVFNPDKLIANPKDFHIYNIGNGKMESDEVRSVLCDRQGAMWIAETGNGFAVCQPPHDYANLRIAHYDTGDGLINGMVQAFVEDRQGYVWISTDYGLSRFDPKTKTFRNFLLSQSMARNIYSENCATMLGDGRLLFGTNNGIAMVDPSLIGDDNKPATITFTSLSVNGIRMTPDDDEYPLDCALPYAKEINLNHDQNSIIIYFSTLDFTPDTKTLYSYRLDNYDADWSEASSLNFAAYKKLSPGTYRLHVRAMGSDGTWSKQESVITINVAPPFWASPWAYIIYIIAIAIIAYIAFRTLKKMDALRTQVKVEEQLADYKLVFFTNISHEFRTPLTLIETALERIERNPKNTNERNAAVELMKKSVARMLRLINELLEFRKAEKGKLTLQLEETEMVKLLRRYFEMFKDAAHSKNMKYRYEPAVDSITMPADRGKIDKIVYNLLSNAFKYTPMGGAITLSVALDKDGEHIIIKVKDTGIGIAEDRREKIFTRFATGNTSRNSIGIGLHLVHELVTAHKGTIAYSENPDGGSIFTVTLPANDTPYSEEDYLKAEAASPQPSPDGEGAKLASEDDSLPHGGRLEGASSPLNDRTILVVEDDDDIRQLLVNELSKYATIVARADGSTGLEYAKNEDVDLVLCDVMMPGMDGFEVTRRLKNDFQTSHIPVILLTALSADESRIKGAQSGADGYITKPFSSKLLLTTIFKLIEQREKLKEKFSSDITVKRTFVSIDDTDKAFADKLAEVVEKNLSNFDFTADDFAEALNLGHTIMYRKVKGVTGYTPKAYLRIMRMKKAAELLLQPDMNVSEVAYAVGMSDPLYFSKCFKQQFGMPPSEYKAK